MFILRQRGCARERRDEGVTRALRHALGGRLFMRQSARHTLRLRHHSWPVTGCLRAVAATPRHAAASSRRCPLDCYYAEELPLRCCYGALMNEITDYDTRRREAMRVSARDAR